MACGAWAWCFGRAESLRRPMARSTRLKVCLETETRNSSHSHWPRSHIRTDAAQRPERLGLRHNDAPAGGIFWPSRIVARQWGKRWMQCSAGVTTPNTRRLDPNSIIAAHTLLRRPSFALRAGCSTPLVRALWSKTDMSRKTVCRLLRIQNHPI